MFILKDPFGSSVDHDFANRRHRIYKCDEEPTP
jgi:hypothetical protein